MMITSYSYYLVASSKGMQLCYLLYIIMVLYMFFQSIYHIVSYDATVTINTIYIVIMHSNILPILCSVTLDIGIVTTPIDMLTKANKLKVTSVVSLVSITLPVVIVNKYIDW